MSDTHVPYPAAVSYDELAFWYNRMIWAVGACLVLVIVPLLIIVITTASHPTDTTSLDFFLAPTSVDFLQLIRIPFSLIFAYCLYQTATRLFPAKNKGLIVVLIIVAAFFPFLMLIFLVSASIRSTKLLKENGYVIGWLGAKKK